VTVLSAEITADASSGGHAEHPVAAPNPPAERPIPLAETDDFAEFFRSQYPRLIRSLRLAGAPAGDAEDIAQEAFARMLRHWRRVRRGPSPAGYLYRTAFRLLGRRGHLEATPLDEALPDPGPGPEERAVAAVGLADALAAMPARRRACVVLCWCLDATTTDAADALGIAPGTVRKQLELARRALRAGPLAAPEAPGQPYGRPPA